MNTENKTAIDVENINSSREILHEVYDALSEKGYDPIGQIVGYLLSEDPTYITNCNNARALIRKVDRDALLRELVQSYLELSEADDEA